MIHGDTRHVHDAGESGNLGQTSKVIFGSSLQPFYANKKYISWISFCNRSNATKATGKLYAFFKKNQIKSIYYFVNMQNTSLFLSLGNSLGQSSRRRKF